MPKLPFDEESPFYTATEVEVLFGHNRRTVGAWLNKGLVPGAIKHPGGHWRIPESALIELLTGMGWSKDRVEEVLKEYKNSI